MNAAKTFHDGGVVSGGVSCDALQRIDAADAHVELVGAELLDRLDIPVGRLSLLGQLICAPRQDGVLRREYHRTCRPDEMARECQVLSAERSKSSELVARRLGARDVFPGCGSRPGGGGRRQANRGGSRRLRGRTRRRTWWSC